MLGKIVCKDFKSQHFNAKKEHFYGNNEIGRYIFVPGDNSRAKFIAEKYFKNLEIIESPRGHNLYLGDINFNGITIKVASISTGMGTPSVDLILTELLLLGAKRFLRIGTAGSLQDNVKVGDVVFATASVRDESTSSNYIPVEFPAIADLDFTLQAQAIRNNRAYNVILGQVHTKASLYAREYLLGPLYKDSQAYMSYLKSYGVLATDMETSHIYVLSKLYEQELNCTIKSGSVLAIVGDTSPFSSEEAMWIAIKNAVDFGVELVKRLAYLEVNQ